MIITPQGKIQYQTPGELRFNLFMAMGIGINNMNYLYDQETNELLRFKDKYIKSDIYDQPIYAGRNDVIFDQSKSYHLLVTLFGWYIDKREASDEPIYYVAQGVEVSPDKEYSSVFVDTQNGRIQSDKYHGSFLGYIECIFLMDGTMVDLHNLDIIPEKPTKRGGNNG